MPVHMMESLVWWLFIVASGDKGDYEKLWKAKEEGEYRRLDLVEMNIFPK